MNRLQTAFVFLIAAILFPFAPSFRLPKVAPSKKEFHGISMTITDTLAGESISEYWINGKPSRYWKAKELGDDMAFIEGRA